MLLLLLSLLTINIIIMGLFCAVTASVSSKVFETQCRQILNGIFTDKCMNITR